CPRGSARPGRDRRGDRAGCGAAGGAAARGSRAGARLHVARRGPRDGRGLPRGGGVSGPLVVIDADALGRRRTGDETYVEGLLGALARHRGDLRIAAVTRRPDLVPEGIERL